MYDRASSRISDETYNDSLAQLLIEQEALDPSPRLTVADSVSVDHS